METNNSPDVVEHQEKEAKKAQEEKESHDANIANGVNEGALLALSAYGPQDKFMELGDLFDVKKVLVDRFQVSYSEIPCTTKYLTKSTYQEIVFTVKRACDLINMVDFAVPNPENLSLNKIIKKISVEFGGQRMDIISTDDIETHIQTNCALFNRKINYINGTTFVPLTIAPFHANNLCMSTTINHHELCIKIEVYDGIDMFNCKLYGNMYYLNKSNMYYLNKKEGLNDMYDFVTVQNQHCGMQQMNVGINSFKIHFNHPMYLIYFWGFDKKKVKNIKLTFMDKPYYDGPIEPLEHLKLSKGYDIEPVVIFFSHDMVGAQTKSSINFSKIDESNLIIETTQQGEFPIYIVGLNMQVVRHHCGMVAMVYSK
jgi:hypothetical protein